MAGIFQKVEDYKKMHPSQVDTFSSPYFIHPFDDPDILEKLSVDRRTCAYLDDPEFLDLLKELKDNPETFE